MSAFFPILSSICLIAGIVLLVLYWLQDNWQFYVGIGVTALGLVGLIVSVYLYVRRKKHSTDQDDNTPVSQNILTKPILESGVSHPRNEEEIVRILTRLRKGLELYKKCRVRTNSSQNCATIWGQIAPFWERLLFYWNKNDTDPQFLLTISDEFHILKQKYDVLKAIHEDEKYSNKFLPQNIKDTI